MNSNTETFTSDMEGMNMKNNINNTATAMEARANAAELHEVIRRINSIDHYDENDTGSKTICFEDRNGRIYRFSCRIGQALEVRKQMIGYLLINDSDPESCFDMAVRRCSEMWGITPSAIISKITREIGITGKGATDRVRNLYIDSLISEDAADELLNRMIIKATNKDSVCEIRSAFKAS